MSLKSIFNKCNLDVTRYDRVHGGDINECYRLHTPDKQYFLKVNSAERFPGMFEKEEKGLEALRNGSPLRVPVVIMTGETEGQQFLLMEWIDTGKLIGITWSAFGAGLAEQHRKPQPYFGFEHDNYIGSLQQVNTSHDKWSKFYTACRIMPLVQKLHDAGHFSLKEVSMAEKRCSEFENIFPSETASLLHGDLWSGNYLIANEGYAAIFDPAVYYGHREMDIGMTLLFGGFHSDFYKAYQETYPLEKDWQQRLPLTQLYPLLVHAVLFGGHYIGSVRTIIKT